MADENDMVEAHFRRSCETLDRAAQDSKLRNAIYAIAEVDHAVHSARAGSS